MISETEELKQIDTSTELAQFDAAKAEVDALKPYLELKVSGVDDKDGFEAVKKADREALKVAKKIEDARVVLKKPYRDAGKQVDQTAKRYSSQVEEVRKHLGDQKKIVTDEQLRLKRVEAERKQAEEEAGNKLAIERTKLLDDVGHYVDREDVHPSAMTQEQFDALLAEQAEKCKARVAEKAAETKRQTELAEANRIEQERLDAEREEIRKDRAKLQAEAQRITDAKEAAETEARHVKTLDRLTKVSSLEFPPLAGMFVDLTDDEFDVFLNSETEAEKERKETEAKAAAEQKASRKSQELKDRAAKADGLAESVKDRRAKSAFVWCLLGTLTDKEQTVRVQWNARSTTNNRDLEFDDEVGFLGSSGDVALDFGLAIIPGGEGVIALEIHEGVAFTPWMVSNIDIDCNGGCVIILESNECGNIADELAELNGWEVGSE